MEKLLKSRGIDIVSMTGSHYAYNQDLLDKKLLVEFYHYEIDPESETGEIETAVFVLAVDSDSSYHFTVFYEIGLLETAPIVLFRVITDLVDFIKICDQHGMIRDLTEISSGVTTSKEWTHEKDRDATYLRESAKFDSVMELIAEKRNSSGSI